MSERQNLKRRGSPQDEQERKRPNRQPSVPGLASSFTNSTSMDRNSSENNKDAGSSTIRELKPRRADVKNYVESDRESDSDTEAPNRRIFDNAAYEPGKKAPKARSSQANNSKKETEGKSTRPEDNDKVLQKAMEDLKITDEDMVELCQVFKIPYCFEQKKRANGNDHYTASTMPLRILEEYGWKFNDTCSITRHQEATDRIYLTEGTERIGFHTTPQFFAAASSDPNAGPKIYHSRVVEGITRLMESMQYQGDVLHIPDDWANEEYIGGRPVLPEDFERFAREVTPEKALEIPKVPGTVGSLVSTWESENGSPNKSQLAPITEEIKDVAIILEKQDDITPHHQPLDSEGIIGQSSRDGEPSNTDQSRQGIPCLSTVDTEASHSTAASDFDTPEDQEKDHPDSTPGPSSDAGNTSDSEQAPLISSSKAMLDIPSLEEALDMWKEWQPKLHEKSIGRFAAEKLCLLPHPGSAIRLKKWLEPFTIIHDIKSDVARVRSEFEIASTSSCIKYVERAVITDRGMKTKKGVKGDISLNEYTTDPSRSAARLVLNWATFVSFREDQQVTELEVEGRLGELVTGLFGGEEWEGYRDQSVEFALPLRPFDTAPKPDYAVRVSGPKWGHLPMKLKPIVFSADAKSDDKATVAGQLAMNSIGTLILFIFFYLDTRSKAEGRIPGFCWIPAIVYHRDGFEVFAHYPKPEPDGNGGWEWGFASRLLSDRHKNVWCHDHTTHRMKGLDAFTRLRTHAYLISERLEAWMGGDKTLFNGRMAASPDARKVLDQLIARARYESKEYDWVKQKAKEIRAEKMENNDRSAKA